MRGNARKRKARSKVEQLEQKMEGLMALLTQNNNGPQPANAAANPRMLSPATTPASQDTSQTPGDIIDDGLLSLARAEQLVQRFKTYRIPNFPFVVIPEHVTAATLRHQAPSLFLAVVTVCLEDEGVLQSQLAEKFKEIVCNSLIMNNEKSLELLQALLVLLGWFQYQCPPKQQIYLFRHMAWALASDLVLDRPPGREPLKDPLQCAKSGPIIPQCGLVVDESKPESWAAARHRAFLGCFYLNNSSTTFRRHMAGMKHTK
jgi:hypothetical protein